MPTLSLASLKGFLTSCTPHEVRIIDLIFHKKDWKNHVKRRILEERPDAIGFSVLSFNYQQALTLARWVKNFCDAPIIFGGVHAILTPDEIMRRPEVDILCTGEGEHALKDLLDHGLECDAVPGLWYRKNGGIIKNAGRRLVENLEELFFPDWEDFELEKYFHINNHHLPVMASRGCPYECTYCSNHALKKVLEGKYVRFRPASHVIKEIGLRIEQYEPRGFQRLFFYDDIFICHRSFVLDFCRQYREKGYHRRIPWNANVRANLVTEEIITAMKEAGCYEVRMGVEAGNDDIRNRVYKRNMSRSEIQNAISVIKKNGLQLRLQFILGAPYENIDMMRESFEMAKKADPDYALFPILVPLPATEIKRVCEEEGLIEKKQLEHFQDMYSEPVVRTKFTSRNEIKKLVRQIKRYQAAKYIKMGFHLAGLRFLWDALVFFLYERGKYDLELEHLFRFTVYKYKLEKRPS